ncbi:hypothetical protein CDAR_117901 [Caerostris darwini]|uniref:Uncharacterized protein n=1 Tax=Caerostris darwini TaxID=1538125 RepID=A0AAV4PVR8_9ARAC|nr:hypothetical protein CDAR_117901 [Caerostris darwini]
MMVISNKSIRFFLIEPPPPMERLRKCRFETTLHRGTVLTLTKQTETFAEIRRSHFPTWSTQNSGQETAEFLSNHPVNTSTDCTTENGFWIRLKEDLTLRF